MAARLTTKRESLALLGRSASYAAGTFNAQGQPDVPGCELRLGHLPALMRAWRAGYHAALRDAPGFQEESRGSCEAGPDEVIFQRAESYPVSNPVGVSPRAHLARSLTPSGLSFKRGYSIMSIAERIRTARRKAGITQTVLGQRAKISQPVVCRLENVASKGHKIDPRVLDRVAKALGVTSDYLRSGKK